MRRPAQLATPGSAWQPLDSLQRRASAISRSPSAPSAPSVPPSHTHTPIRPLIHSSTHPLCRQASRQAGRIHVLFAPLRLLAPSALTRLRGRWPPRSTPSAFWLLGFKGTARPAGLACRGSRWPARRSVAFFVTLPPGPADPISLAPGAVARRAFVRAGRYTTPSIPLTDCHQYRQHQQQHRPSTSPPPTPAAALPPRRYTSDDRRAPSNRLLLPSAPAPSALHCPLRTRDSVGAMASTARNNPHNELMSALSTSVSSRPSHLSIHIRQRNQQIASWAVLTCATGCTSVGNTLI